MEIYTVSGNDISKEKNAGKDIAEGFVSEEKPKGDVQGNDNASKSSLNGISARKNPANSSVTSKKIVYTAMFTALAYVASLFPFPIFPAAPYLKFDFGNVFILMSGFTLGPAGGVAVCALKEGLCVLKSTSGGIGDLANFLMTVSYIIIPCVVYKKSKTEKALVLSLVLGCVLGIITALAANRYIVFPLYMGESAAQVFNGALLYVILFNLIKTALISIVSVILYKRLLFGNEIINHQT